MLHDLVRQMMQVPEISHFVFGLIGGIAYVLVQLTYGNQVKIVEYVSRPFLGGVLAILATITLGLPNHATSFFVGYFCIDALDALLAFGARKIGFKVPESMRNEPRTLEKDVARREVRKKE